MCGRARQRMKYNLDLLQISSVKFILTLRLKSWRGDSDFESVNNIKKIQTNKYHRIRRLNHIKGKQSWRRV